MTRHALPRLAALTAAMLVPAVAPTVASAAGTAQMVSGGTLQFTAAVGDTNTLKVTLATPNIVLEDTTASLNAGSGCTQVTAQKVNCPSNLTTGVTIATSDKNDSIESTVPRDVSIAAGSGDDTLKASGTGSKFFGGGSGYDFVSFSSSTVPVYGSINGSYDDGPFESSGWDYISSDIEMIGGGSAGDVLIGSDTQRTVLTGLGGANDLTAGSAGADLQGGSGSETLNGAAGNDAIVGGGGTDKFDGKGGNDTIYAKDGVGSEKITCGSGTDTVSADTTDIIVDPANCETITY